MSLLPSVPALGSTSEESAGIISMQMEEIERPITMRPQEIDEDIISIRNDVLVMELWGQLCKLHRSGIALCLYSLDPGSEA